MTTAELIDHEAGHAAAAGVLGVYVIHASIVPNGANNGRVTLAVGSSREDCRRRMKVILAGLLESDMIPSWPLRTDRSFDERDLAELVEQLDLDASGYERAVDDTFELSFDRMYRLLHTTVGHMFQFTPHIDHDLFEQLRTITIKQVYPMSDTIDIDAELAAIERREAAYKAKQSDTVQPAADTMTKALTVAYAKADKAHRMANEHVEIKSFAC